MIEIVRTYPKVTSLIKGRLKEISQRQLARELELPLLSIQRYAKGTSAPNEASLKKIAAYFNTTIHDLKGELDAYEILGRIRNAQNLLNEIGVTGDKKLDGKLGKIAIEIGEVDAINNWNIILSKNSIKEDLEQRIIECSKDHAEILKLLKLIVVIGKDNSGYSPIYGEIIKGKQYLIDEGIFPDHLFVKLEQPPEPRNKKKQ